MLTLFMTTKNNKIIIITTIKTNKINFYNLLYIIIFILKSNHLKNKNKKENVYTERRNPLTSFK